MSVLKHTALASALGAALLGSSFAFAAPPIEQGRPTLINQPGGVLASDLITDEQLREELSGLQRQLSERYATQDGLTQLLDRLLQMEREVQTLRGEVEELNERLRRAEQDNRDRYIDLDQRLTELQASGGQGLTGQRTDVTEVTDSEDEQQDYRRARDLIAERQYEQAITALSDFVADHPDSGLASDAYFWQGEVHTLLREYDSAERAYRRILDDYPDASKRLDARFKLGFVAERTGDIDAAIDHYEQVIDEAPDSNLANLSRQRLDALQSP